MRRIGSRAHCEWGSREASCVILARLTDSSYSSATLSCYDSARLEPGFVPALFLVQSRFLRSVGPERVKHTLPVPVTVAFLLQERP